MKLSSAGKTRLMTQYGPWALITGASSGIGFEIAKLLGESGFSLILCSRQEKLLEEIAEDFQKKYKVEVKVISCDLSKQSDIKRLISVSKKFDIGLFIPAAGFGTSGSFLASDIETEINMLDVNCRAVLELTHHFSHRFVERKKGGIILLSSIVAFQGVPYAANYAATKAYIQSLAESLSIELHSYGVDVLSAAPGPVNSGFAARAGMRMSQALEASEIAAPILKALGRKRTVYPGLLTKVLINALRTVPRWAKVRIMKNVMRGMTKHQQTIRTIN